MIQYPIGQTEALGPWPCSQAKDGKRSRGQSGEQRDQVLSQDLIELCHSAYTLEGKEQRIYPDERTREVKPQLGSTGNSNDYSHWENCVLGSWRGSKGQASIA